MRLPRNYLSYKITVWPFIGSGPTEPVYGGAFTERAHVMEGLPINISTGAEEVTGNVSVWMPPGRPVPPRSKVSINGVLYTVVNSEKHAAPRLPTPDHIKLLLAPYAEDED